MPARVYSTCTLPGCSNPHYATGLCRGHYVARRAAAVRAASYPINAAPQHVPVPAAPQRAVDLPPVFNDKGQPGFPVRDSSRPPGWKQAQAVPAAPCVPPAPVLTPSRPVPDVPAPPPVLPHAPNVPAAPMLPIIPAPPGFPRSK